jgi:hypothetical protein
MQEKIESLLSEDPDRSYSKEEILNLLSTNNEDEEIIEKILAEMEVLSSLKVEKSNIYASCRGGTVYFKWNKT